MGRAIGQTVEKSAQTRVRPGFEACVKPVGVGVVLPVLGVVRTPFESCSHAFFGDKARKPLI